MDGWKGPPRRFEADQQVYYTSPVLAEKVVEISTRQAPRGALFFDVGVGEGAIFNRLPQPKGGVELDKKGSLNGVKYGIDILKWTEPKAWKNKHIVVVMNPPFRKQVDIINRCSRIECLSLTVVWIAGLGVRNWDVEDKINPYLHLTHEWLTPPEWSKFERHGTHRHLSTTVQVWIRKVERISASFVERYSSQKRTGHFLVGPE